MSKIDNAYPYTPLSTQEFADLSLHMTACSAAVKEQRWRDAYIYQNRAYHVVLKKFTQVVARTNVMEIPDSMSQAPEVINQLKMFK